MASARSFPPSFPPDADPSGVAGRSIQEMIFSTAARFPDKTAIRWGAVTWTFAELERSALVAAERLAARGVGPGVRVGLCGGRTPATLAGLTGILATGAAYVPVDPAWPEERRNFALRDAGVDGVVTDDPACVPRGWDPLALPPVPAAAAPDFSPHPSAQTDPVYIIYTSGSTGRPKGVVIPQRALGNFVGSMAREPGVSADDVVLASTTFAFDMSVFEIYLPLVTGAEMLLVSEGLRRDGRGLAAEMERGGVTVAQGTPGLWRLLRASGWEGKSTLKILTGAEPVPRALVDDLADRCRELWVMYGPTETTVWSTCCRVGAGGGTVPIGRPIAGTRIVVVNERGDPVADGEPGELLIGGRGVALGYLGQPELTAERFVADPSRPEEMVYRTGDLVRRRDGMLEFIGRTDDQVKIRGYRVELGEVENRLECLPGVRQAAVVLRREDSGPRLVGWYVGEAAAETLREELVRVLPEYMVPSLLFRISRIPLTANGKVDRAALAARATESGTRVDPPRSAAEETVQALWAEVLGRAGLGCGENFFEAGGDSVSLVALHARLVRVSAHDLPLAELFAHPTIRSQARLLEGGAEPSDDPRARAMRQRAALAVRRKTLSQP